MKDVNIECTLSLPSQEYLDLYTQLAEDGRLGDFISQAFIQAASQNNPTTKKVEQKIDSLKENMRDMQVSIVEEVLKAIKANAGSLPSPSVEKVESVESTEPPVKKEKTVVKRRKTKKPVNLGGGLAGLASASAQMNARSKRGDT
ncbi:hypothetical protein [uncultured Clostridium sp.]|uniref:hypothetical protein n=1 Tax=uncultured Clostridium sp. TaxID=59620 RepID=UPI0026F3C3F9|nr:hypothetical protein [uncultured Clostridium sp.]